MGTTITDGTTTLMPVAVTEFDSSRISYNIIHDIIDSSDGEVSLRAAGLREGTIEYAFSSLSAAAAAEAFHAQPLAFDLANSTEPDIDMTYVVNDHGRISMKRDEQRGVWLVRVDFREVAT